MSDRIRNVLNYIVREYAVRDEQREIDLNAAPSESGAQLEAAKRAAAKREVSRAEDLGDAFRAGLIAAYHRHAAGQPALVLDDRDPAESRMADALITFLVAHDLASSGVEEQEPSHFIYSVEVDWARLGDVARATGVDLTHALTAASP